MCALSWWVPLGEVFVVERLSNPGQHPSRLIYFEGGKFDFTIIPAAEPSRSQYERLFEVLLDKDGQAGDLRVRQVTADLPNAAEFEERIHWGYAAAIMCAKAVVSDEPWSVKVRDLDLKEALLIMIEWDHLARYGVDYDV
jgi:aminoglycoside 6-adenylyltransferase